MEASRPKRVLVVANRTAAAPRLLDEVRSRARSGPCRFTLLVPDVADRGTADWTLDGALPLLEGAARGPVEGMSGGPDPFASIQQAVRGDAFDEIIISMLPRRRSKWLRRDLVRRVEQLGLPVTAIIPHGGSLTSAEAAKTMVEFGAGPGGGAIP